MNLPGMDDAPDVQAAVAHARALGVTERQIQTAALKGVQAAVERYVLEHPEEARPLLAGVAEQVVARVVKAGVFESRVYSTLVDAVAAQARRVAESAVVSVTFGGERT